MDRGTSDRDILWLLYSNIGIGMDIQEHRHLIIARLVSTLAPMPSAPWLYSTACSWAPLSPLSPEETERERASRPSLSCHGEHRVQERPDVLGDAMGPVGDTSPITIFNWFATQSPNSRPRIDLIAQAQSCADHLRSFSCRLRTLPRHQAWRPVTTSTASSSS
jgi:hypothetical protein